jgi:hypothetical protein
LFFATALPLKLIVDAARLLAEGAAASARLGVFSTATSRATTSSDTRDSRVQRRIGVLLPIDWSIRAWVRAPEGAQGVCPGTAETALLTEDTHRSATLFLEAQ